MELTGLKARLDTTKKVIIAALVAVIGLLLTLAGLNLIQMSSNLVLYSGVALLILAILQYLF